jgi:hypothetical protein
VVSTHPEWPSVAAAKYEEFAVISDNLVCGPSNEEKQVSSSYFGILLCGNSFSIIKECTGFVKANLISQAINILKAA